MGPFELIRLQVLRHGVLTVIFVLLKYLLMFRWAFDKNNSLEWNKRRFAFPAFIYVDLRTPQVMVGAIRNAKMCK